METVDCHEMTRDFDVSLLYGGCFPYGGVAQRTSLSLVNDVK